MSTEDNDNNPFSDMWLAELIRQAYEKNMLAEVIGKTLDKNVVVLALIDEDGGVQVIGSQNPESATYERDKSMKEQIAALFEDNMKDMMQKAGEAHRIAVSTLGEN